MAPTALPLAITPHQERALDPLPFAAPDAFDADLEAFLQDASHQLCHWLGSAVSRPPLPGLSLLPAVEPEHRGLGAERLLADLHLVMEGAYNPNHPGALAHLDPPPLSASLVGDLICAGLNNNLLAEELSPSLSRLERSLCGWLARRLGLGEHSGGVPASGGSLSNLMALVTARESRGLRGVSEAVVLCGLDSHTSLEKAAMVMGLPAASLRRLPLDHDGRLEPERVAECLEALSAAGLPVIALVATAGTTVRGAVDPLVALAALCRRHGVWLHIDAAIGGVLGLTERHRQRVEGLALADSITINPQKLLGITKTSSLLLLADPSALERSFATGLPYMELSREGGHGGECGLQGSRGAEILKLWLGLRQLGLEGIEAVIEGAIQRRRRLQQLLQSAQETGELSLLSGPLHLLAFRPSQLGASGCEQWSQQCRQQLLAHDLMLSRPRYQGKHHLKAVLGNPHTEEEHLQLLAALVRQSLPPRTSGHGGPGPGPSEQQP